MTVQISDLSKTVLDTEYAVRGPIVARAQDLERQGREIIYCNIGNPQALEQKPLTYLRQVLAVCQYPALVEKAPGVLPDDVVETAQRILKGTKHGLGAYSESKGVRFIREAVAEFIRERDGIDADPEAIYLTDGASKGVQTALRILISGPQDGIMIPIPQYPLYSATITLYDGRQIGYYLDEGHDWRLSWGMLEESLEAAQRDRVTVKGICVLNPGNPTGSVLDRDNIAMIIDFARRHNLAILADEVYQETQGRLPFPEPPVDLAYAPFRFARPNSPAAGSLHDIWGRLPVREGDPHGSWETREANVTEFGKKLYRYWLARLRAEHMSRSK